MANKLYDLAVKTDSYTDAQGQALKEYGIARLGARILELKEKGHTITRQLVPVQNRFGDLVYVAQYSLSSKDLHHEKTK